MLSIERRFGVFLLWGDAMKEQEKIPVFILIGPKGKTVCVCHASRKGCNRKCERDEVTRDIYAGWIYTLYRNKYGQ